MDAGECTLYSQEEQAPEHLKGFQARNVHERAQEGGW